jgi:hypothetical protein
MGICGYVHIRSYIRRFATVCVLGRGQIRFVDILCLDVLDMRKIEVQRNGMKVDAGRGSKVGDFAAQVAN